MQRKKIYSYVLLDNVQRLDVPATKRTTQVQVVRPRSAASDVDIGEARRGWSSTRRKVPGFCRRRDEETLLWDRAALSNWSLHPAVNADCTAGRLSLSPPATAFGLPPLFIMVKLGHRACITWIITWENLDFVLVFYCWFESSKYTSNLQVYSETWWFFVRIIRFIFTIDACGFFKL